MDLRTFHYKGYFEEQEGETAEQVQLLTPGSDIEESLLAWAILPQPQTVENDPARQGYVFRYEIDRHLDQGLYALRITARDQSDVVHAAELAAALTVVGPRTGDATHSFAPFWFLSERLHFQPLEGETHEQYHGSAFGHLHFGGVGHLPHRRLFGAKV